ARAPLRLPFYFSLLRRPPRPPPFPYTTLFRSAGPCPGAAHGDRYCRRIGPTVHDADLVARAQGGDRSALEDLLRLHYDRIHAVCRRMLSNEADALDATQETLLAVSTRLHRYDGRAAFGTWVYRVAVNTCLDEIRRRGRRATLTDDEQLLARRGGRDGAPGLDQTVADSVDIDRALAMLPPDFRACVVLRDLCGLDYAE